MLAVASMLVFATTEIGLGLVQQADAARCNRDLVAVCGVCVNANVKDRWSLNAVIINLTNSPLFLFYAKSVFDNFGVIIICHYLC